MWPSLAALSLCGAVGGTECAVEHLDRVVGHALQRLDAERRDHRIASLGREPGECLVGLLAPSLRQPRPPVRRQPGEIEPLDAKLTDQKRALLELTGQRPGTHARRPGPQPRMARLAAIGDQEPVELRAHRVGELRCESLEGLLVRALARPTDKPHEPIDRRALDPLAAQQLTDSRQQQRRPLVLQRLLHHAHAKAVQLALAERANAGVSSDEQPVLDSCGCADRVLEDRPGRNIQRFAERGERLGRRGREILGDEPEPSQRTELQRDPELVRRATLRTHKREILARRREEPDDLVALDVLRKRPEPLDLGIREKPAW